jgi:hypothetical protein
MKLRPSDRENGLAPHECDLLDVLLREADRWEQQMVYANRSINVGSTMTAEEDAAKWETCDNQNGRLVRAVRRFREMLAKGLTP